ncbi:hypothetical protein A2U01_0114219, partial [Trifolium medium]|nr:hypothetical protein [Trifolium medium]
RKGSVLRNLPSGEPGYPSTVCPEYHPHNPHFPRLYSAVRPLPTSNPLPYETKKKVVLVVVAPQPSKT